MDTRTAHNGQARYTHRDRTRESQAPDRTLHIIEQVLDRLLSEIDLEESSDDEFMSKLEEITNDVLSRTVI